MRHALCFSALLWLPAAAAGACGPDEGLLHPDLTLSASATASGGTFAPLWLTANRHGLGSVRPTSGMLRATLERQPDADSTRRWQLAYGLDVAVTAGHERTFVPQQYYVAARRGLFTLTLGARQQHLVTQDDRLAGGAMSLGINARPLPQARLDIDWFAIPGTRGWWHWRMHGSYGLFTDGAWQRQWGSRWRYATGTLYHEKALYWRIGREDRLPLTYEIGLRMATQFGGTSYNIFTDRNPQTTYRHATGPDAFVDALLCRGSDATDGSDPNTAGNHLGSYVMQLKWQAPAWQARVYWERYFDDQSMLTVQYGIRDMLLGGEVTLPRNSYVSKVVVEWLTTRDQTGAVYHDATPSMPDKMNGRDDYYNHLLYAGWEHYGQTLGHPFLTSVLYNDVLDASHMLHFRNTRVRALHVGLAGQPTAEIEWRALMSLTRNWGTYERPLLPDPRRQAYLFGEATYSPASARGWQFTLGVGVDRGRLLGNSTGAQLTIARRLHL